MKNATPINNGIRKRNSKKTYHPLKYLFFDSSTRITNSITTKMNARIISQKIVAFNGKQKHPFIFLELGS